MAVARARANFTLYDYAAFQPVVLDLDRYRDRGHYDIEVNRLMAKEMASGTAPRAALDAINDDLIALIPMLPAGGVPCYFDPRRTVAARTPR